jgi:predicted metal-dependent HD superfamily phosphohydrolase
MEPVKKLDAEYVVTGELDVNNRKVAIALNLVGLALLFLFGWIFSLVAVAVRPKIDSPNPLSLFSGLEPLSLVLGLVGVLILHELVHGFFFWVFTGDRPKFGVHILYAYAAAPGWYLPRNHFLVIGLAPFISLSLLGLLLLPVVPDSVVPVLMLGLTFNAAGSVGDLVVAGWLLSQPRSLMVHDTGPQMIFYKLATPPVAAMSLRWLKLTDSFGVDQERARRVFADLVAHYMEEGRYYHDLQHVESVLTTVDELKGLAHDLATIQLAVWFHDVIYDSRAADNEIKSAGYARRALSALELQPEIVNRVSELILTTITHRAPADDLDAQILLDADLAELGVDETVFSEQSEALRKEFAWVPEAEFQVNRKRVLNGFLERERIYQTDQLFITLEDKARRNLAKALASPA